MDCSPHHPDPDEGGISSGGTLLVTFPHLVEDHPANENQSLTENLGEVLRRDQVSVEQPTVP